jgi:hypothetical protein
MTIQISQDPGGMPFSRVPLRVTMPFLVIFEEGCGCHGWSSSPAHERKPCACTAPANAVFGRTVSWTGEPGAAVPDPGPRYSEGTTRLANS